ncbi:hypothetical protein MMC08_008928 [Hypocenomyce scalaris]|nr:hypothetical protein [Hypocenomyce scalaris]
MSYNTGSREPGLDWKYHALPVLDVEAATAKIKEGEASHKFGPGELGMVSRCDTVQVASNAIMEDYMVSTSMDMGKNQKWHGWAIYDGHAGRDTAAVLSHSLIPYVERSLQSHHNSASSVDAFDATIISAFTTLDNDISSDGIAALSDARSHSEVQARLAPCYAGSCALLAMYNPAESVVHVAGVGDSRAVLGRPLATTGGSELTWTTIPLSSDQTPSNPTEAERVKALHPDEDGLITKRDGDCDRYVGIAVTRAFGDTRWKWSKDLLDICEKQYSGKPPPKNVLNPPYLEATPDVTSMEIQKGDFLIMASDGFWEHLSSEAAVHALGLWVDAVKTGELGKRGGGKATAVGGGPALVDKAEGISFWEPWKVSPECFVVEDDNAATHLVKNAFGGNQRQLFTGVMTVDSPTSKTMRDDVTVQVIFFDDI